MKPLQAKEISGIWATLLIPFQEDQQIDFARLSGEIDYLLSCGVHGIYSNGTAGEFYNQTEEEFDRISSLLAEKCERAGLPFQVGCSHMSPLISLERVKRIKHLRPSAIQVILPDWMVPNNNEILGFLEKMAEASEPVGLVLYNPPHAKKILTPEDFGVILSQPSSVVGCKVAGGDRAWFEDMQPVMEKISVFTPGHKLATGYVNGARGSYSNVACMHPKAAAYWYKLMQEDMPLALAWEKRIQRFFEQFILPFIETHHYSAAAVDKFLAAIGGCLDIGTRVRWPYKSIPPAAIQQVRVEAKRMIPEFINE